ncbi:hypothetical protein BGZ65_001430 [Modicella reniformis]|uniref:F-box domain-containing protein n=1 Tax=Modicella reniformis TaxID=1440133 RepID=A0A9P6MLQ8_9FUNG|nr:hypothetical protein BGZ65_001430 [Modicella reniformis]
MHSDKTEELVLETQARATVGAACLPEIVAIIAQRLGRKDIASSAIVCRAWSIAFTPLLWKEISCRIPNPNNAAILPPLLDKYGHLIRKLTITDIPEDWALKEPPSRQEPSAIEVLDCASIQNVIDLVIDTGRENKIWFRNIIHRNQHTIRDLTLRFVTEQTTRKMPNNHWHGDILFDFPRMMPCLQSLSLSQWQMTREDLILVLKASPALKQLSFSNIRITTSGNLTRTTQNGSSTINSNHSDKDAEDDTFQHLGLEVFKMCSKLYPILDLIPNIKTLEFYRFDRQIDSQELESFCTSVRKHCLHLQQIWAYGFECSMLPPVINSLQNGLIAFRGSSDMATVVSILEHADTLESANLSDYTEKTYMPLRFLETCPRLKEFWTGHTSITMTEAQESIQRGWACRGLKKLRMNIRKLSPALIEAIMQDLNAERSRELREQEKQELQVAMSALTPEQREFQREFSMFLKGLTDLTQVNLATGWYIIPQPASQ